MGAGFQKATLWSLAQGSTERKWNRRNCGSFKRFNWARRCRYAGNTFCTVHFTMMPNTPKTIQQKQKQEYKQHDWLLVFPFSPRREYSAGSLTFHLVCSAKWAAAFSCPLVVKCFHLCRRWTPWISHWSCADNSSPTSLTSSSAATPTF